MDLELGRFLSICVSVRKSKLQYRISVKRSPSLKSIIDAIIAEPETYSVPDDPNVVRKILLELANHTRSLERQVSRWRQAATQHGLSSAALPSDDSSNGDHSEPVPSGPDSVEVLAGAMKDLTLRNNSKTYRHFGKSSNMMMMKTAALVKEEILGEPVHIDPCVETQRMEFWTLYPVSFSYHCSIEVSLNICIFIFGSGNVIRAHWNSNHLSLFLKMICSIGLCYQLMSRRNLYGIM